jgi:hypothetical protein
MEELTPIDELTKQHRAALEHAQAITDANALSRQMRDWQQKAHGRHNRAALALTAVDSPLTGWSGKVAICGDDASLCTLIRSCLQGNSRLRYIVRTALEIVDLEGVAKEQINDVEEI